MADETDIYGGEPSDEVDNSQPEGEQPAYRIFKDSRIPVSRNLGPVWKNRYDAAKAAYKATHDLWDEAIRYYNNHQSREADTQTSEGIFRRGDNSENFVYSNVNTMLPMIYGKDPDYTCNTTDGEDQPFCDTMQVLLNTLIRRRDKVDLKPKARRAAGFALLTNQGVVKLDWTRKDDSREVALQEYERLVTDLEKTEDQAEVNAIYGRMEALERQMEVLQPSGPSSKSIRSRQLIIDPYAEQPNGLDGNWMMEECFISTASLNAQFTDPDPEQDDAEIPEHERQRVYTYKPTHKAQFAEGGKGDRDDGLGLVMISIAGEGNDEAGIDAERRAYIDMYYTQCVFVWDKWFKRVYLFQKEDWTWPIWVWDDPLNITRFFPYFVFGFSFSTGGCTSVGEVAYYLDQQDTINDINRQARRIRRSVFNHFFYDSSDVDKDEIEKFLKAIRGINVSEQDFILGIDAAGKDISKMIQVLEPPALEYEQLFNKSDSMEAINRISGTNDAARGQQFKTNTNVPAVQMYQQQMQLSSGNKTDSIEDSMSDLGYALAELCIQNYTREDVVGLIGEKAAQGWIDGMTLEAFRAEYSLDIVAGSMEKPNSVFKKQEATQVAQVMGQFARGAPASAMAIMLKMLQRAFTDLNVTKEDWDMLNQEFTATLQKGVSSGQAGTGESVAGESPGGESDLMARLQSLPDEAKEQVVAMKQQGASDEELLAFIQQAIAGTQGATSGTIQ